MRPTQNLYEPATTGFAIYQTKPGRFLALRKRWCSGNVLKKSALFYSVEDARAWLDAYAYLG